MQTTVKQVIAILQADSALQTLLNGTTSDKRIYPKTPNQAESFPCIVYAVIGSNYRAAPAGAQDVNIQFDIFSTASKQVTEDVFTRLVALLNYIDNKYSNIVYVIQTAEVDSNPNDRQLFIKTVRFKIFTAHN